jgi:ribosomal protein S18 acetylase RimI-like enzyme
MNIELYFLRSSESKIVENMLQYAYRLDVLSKTINELPQLKKMSNFYGLTTKDLGLYALYENKIAGAVWSRELDSKIPTISMAVLPEFQMQGIGTQIMEQFLQEAGALYTNIEVNVLKDSKAINFYKKFGFVEVKNSEQKSLVDENTTITLSKHLVQKEVIRPKDNYDANYWMD